MISQTPCYRGYRFPREIISHAVWLYHRFCLSFRDTEDLLAQRGITVSYETIRQWCRTASNWPGDWCHATWCSCRQSASNSVAGNPRVRSGYCSEPASPYPALPVVSLSPVLHHSHRRASSRRLSRFPPMSCEGSIDADQRQSNLMEKCFSSKPESLVPLSWSRPKTRCANTTRACPPRTTTSTTTKSRRWESWRSSCASNSGNQGAATGMAPSSCHSP